MNKRWYKLFVPSLLLWLALVVPNNPVNAQQLSLELEPSPILQDAQTINLTGLGINSEGSGPVLISGFLENLSGETQENLYIKLTITASKVGNILELTQKAQRPFSLDPYQTVYITNNHLANEKIPGIEETISFTGGLTSEGEDLIYNQSGSTSLPRDIYGVEMVIFQVTDALGREELVNAYTEIGGASLSSFDEGDIFLKTPGDVVGSGAEITNPYPQFSWEGDNNTTYRLLVVEQDGQDSPESLLQSAKSSQTINEGGSLLEFENLDVTVEGTSYQFPSSGAQSLVAGNTYFWRVITTLQSSGDVQEIESEIWSFSLLDATQSANSIPMTNELERMLIEIMGEANYKRLQNSGYKLESIEYNDQEFSGPAATTKLEELVQKIQDEEIILGQN